MAIYPYGFCTVHHQIAWLFLWQEREQRVDGSQLAQLMF